MKLEGLTGAIQQHTDSAKIIESIVAFKNGELVETTSASELFKLWTAAVQAGELFKLRVLIRPHLQGPNANYWRIKSSAYSKLAKSFIGQVFQKDHCMIQDYRGGKIISSKSVGSGDDAYMLQEIEVTEPWAIDGILRGSIDRFSIALNSHDLKAFCSICKNDFWSSSCPHWPGVMYETSAGELVCEAIVYEGSGKETSAVADPAVAGTGVEQIQQLAASKRGIQPPSKEDDMEELEKLKADKASLEADLKAAKEQWAVALQAEKDAHAATALALTEMRADAGAAHGENIQLRANICQDLAAQIRQVRASSDLLTEELVSTLDENTDLIDEEKRLRCSLLADQILIERNRRQVVDPKLPPMDVKAETDRLLLKSPELLAEVLAEVRLLPEMRVPAPGGRGVSAPPTQEERDRIQAQATGTPPSAPAQTSQATLENLANAFRRR